MIELAIIGACWAIGAYLESAEKAYNAEWQLVLDRTHHGSPIKPYDWELEA
tara:strand:+ start:982 stop:1134 length:153 start_codon:yes stop_codon:yes gene_type:complete